MKYKVIWRHFTATAILKLENEHGDTLYVDFFPYFLEVKSDGHFDTFYKNLDKWIDSLIGKTIEIEDLEPFIYKIKGRLEIIEEDK